MDLLGLTDTSLMKRWSPFDLTGWVRFGVVFHPWPRTNSLGGINNSVIITFNN